MEKIGIFRFGLGRMESGGMVVRSTVPPGAEMTDLAGFEACLAHARTITSQR
jgi:hypothetical protein